MTHSDPAGSAAHFGELIRNVDPISAAGRDVGVRGGLVDKLTGSLAAAKTAMKGLATPFVGTAALSAMGALADASKDLVRRQDLFQQQLRQIHGMAPGKRIQEIASATAQAWKIANDAVTSNVAENLKSTRQRVQGPGDAQAQSLANPIGGNQSGDQVFDTLKPTKLMAVPPDPRDVTQLLDLTVKAVVAAGGRLLGSNVRGIVEPGRTATSGRSDQSTGSGLATLIGALKPGCGQAATTELGYGLIAAIPETVGDPFNKAALPLPMRQLLTFFHTDWTRAEALRSQIDQHAASDNYKSLQPSSFEANKENLAALTDGLKQVAAAPLAKPAIGVTKPVIGVGLQHEGAATRDPEVVQAVGAVGAAVAAEAATLRGLAAASKVVRPLPAPASPSGLFSTAMGIETTLGQALPSISKPLIHSASLAALGAGIGRFAELGGGTLACAAIGASAGLALSTLSSGNRPFLSTDGIGGMRVDDSIIPPLPNTHAAVNDPMPVYVVNGRDLADGTSARQAHQLARPPTGPTAPDVRMNLPMPGMVLPAMIGP